MKLKVLIVWTVCLFCPVFGGTMTTDSAAVFGDAQMRQTGDGTAYRLYQDVPYLGPDREQGLDLYLPAACADAPRPAVLIIHGGGWTGGQKDAPREIAFAEFMIDRGYAAASISYQLTLYEGRPWHSKRIKGGWPQNIYDCKSALRFLRHYREALNIDDDRLAVMGGSAGGHLALLVGLSANCQALNAGGLYTDQRNDVRGILNFYGIPDVRRWGGSSFIDVPRQTHPDVWALASPVEHLSDASPPILIVHGDKDQTVAIELSEEFVAILEENELPYTYVVVEGGPHSFALEWKKTDLRPVVGDFLDTCFQDDNTD